MRTRTYWNGLIDTALAPLALSSSGAAAWKMLQTICVNIALALDGFWQTFQADINNALATKQPGTLTWYAAIAKEFQYGDSLIVTDGVLGYAADNAAARIITQAAVKEVDDELIVLKLAKTAGSDLAALSGPELTAFKNYLLARRIPGVKVNATSFAPDTILYTMAVLFEARIDQTALNTAIQAALTAYRNTLPFDAVVYKSEIIQVVMGVEGVIDCTLDFDVTFSSGGSALAVVDSVELKAGYFNWDNASTIIYTAQ